MNEVIHFRYKRHVSCRFYFWQYIGITSVSLYICFLILSWYNKYEISIKGWGLLKNYMYARSNGFSGTYHDFINELCINSFVEAAVLTVIGLLGVLLLLLFVRLMFWIIDRF